MTKEEILKNTTWDDYEMGNCPLFVNLFEKKLPFVFIQEHKPKPSITNKMTECVNQILLLNKSEIEIIKEMLWEECNFAFTVGDYGCEPKNGETHLEANLKCFEISNMEDAYSKSEIEEIYISQENDKLNGHYSQIMINSASDNLISIIVKNGKIIDFVDDGGCNMSVFDNDEEYAKKWRQKTLE